MAKPLHCQLFRGPGTNPGNWLCFVSSLTESDLTWSALCMNWKISVNGTKELWFPWELSAKSYLQRGVDAWSSRVGRSCYQTVRHLVP